MFCYQIVASCILGINPFMPHVVSHKRTVANSTDPDQNPSPDLHVSRYRNSEACRERNELYSREYDQGKVTYNDIYFQQ